MYLLGWKMVHHFRRWLLVNCIGRDGVSFSSRTPCYTHAPPDPHCNVVLLDMSRLSRLVNIAKGVGGEESMGRRLHMESHRQHWKWGWDEAVEDKFQICVSISEVVVALSSFPEGGRMESAIFDWMRNDMWRIEHILEDQSHNVVWKQYNQACRLD